MLKLGIEPKTFALLARRSNQLSYSSTGLASSLSLIKTTIHYRIHNNARFISPFS